MPDQTQHGWPPQWPPQHLWPWPAAAAPVPHNQPDHTLLMGRMVERTETMVDHVERMRDDIGEIKERLVHGDHRMTAIESKLADTSAAISKAASPPPSPPPALETWIKSALPYLLAVVGLLATGSIEGATKLLEAARAIAKVGGAS